MNLIEKAREIYLTENDNYLEGTADSAKIVFLYIFYHYFDADTTKIEEVYSQLANEYNGKSFKINSILMSATNENCIDIISYLKESDYKSLSTEDLIHNIRYISTQIGDLVYHTDKFVNSREQELYDNLNFENTSESLFYINILCPFIITVDEKIFLQQKVSEIKISNGLVSFNILFADDIEQEMADIDSPRDSVPFGTATLFSNGICEFGDESSFISLISAKSLKQLFFNYSTKGLFAANLRFYITSSKIDNGIVSTIQNDPSDFCYLNNGIVITCSDYKIINKEIIFYDFSIVNGGQTTNLIGRTNFTTDFGVICKVIKSRFTSEDDNLSFLARVAEASNTQKPIKAKDLIANRVEQRKLKIQFAEGGMFLRIKRGEKIDKKQYPKTYMNATNEELAQILYSCVYQSPGSAKNSSSQLFSNEKIYSLIFKNDYNTDFLKSLQFVKVAYNDWKNDLKKNEARNTIRYGLSKYMNLIVFAILGYIMKFAINSVIYKELISLDIREINTKNDRLKSILKFNDIGNVSLLKPDIFDTITKKTLFNMFDFIVDDILSNAYKVFKKSYPNNSYTHFSKSDKYYYDFILPVLHKKIVYENNKIVDNFGYLLNLNANIDVKPDEQKEEISPKNLKDELLKYRQKIRHCYPEFTDAKILRSNQIVNILRFYPTTIDDLVQFAEFNEFQIKYFSADIIEIVKKYIDLGGFK